MTEEEKQNEKTNEEKKAVETPKDEKKTEKVTEKKDSKKTAEKKPEAREAVVNGRDLPLSKKHCMSICNFIRGKKIEEALPLMEKVVAMKIAVPMKGEIPHRKGRMMSGRYPVKAAGHFIKMLKQLSANAENKEMDIDKGRIECKANRASRPYKRFGSMKFKRTHVTLKLVIKNKKKLKRRKKQ
ncbi:50S ribosomal protein L22 [Candidatus Pacearchaeota archaeon RBG_13_36_9]|nr:large subunit ribosomal protein L22 [uncultured archaeon]OGJ21384.1 MAG: 50S ribosomal protein L22 [Candidatus Pacearchaeota archaeon RBG_13_36_9]